MIVAAFVVASGSLALRPAPAPLVAGTDQTLVVSPSVGLPGDLLAASGSGYLPFLPITLTWDGVEVVETTAGDDGAFDTRFRIPAGATPGIHVVEACYTNPLPDPCADPVRVTVTAPATPTPIPTPPPTPIPPPPTPVPPSATQPPIVTPPTPTPAPTIPVPSFPEAVPTPAPTPMPLVAVTPKPTPPSGVIAPESEFTDLWIKGIEVTQGIQDLHNSMPLVAHRRTYARVYVGTFGADTWPHTYGALEARRGGSQIGWIWPENGPITAKLGAGNRVELDDSLQFRLPQAWLSGDVTLTAFVYSINVDTPFTHEPEWANNFESIDVEFHQADPLTVHLAPLHMHRSYHASDVERVYYGDIGGGGFLANGGSSTMRIVNGLYRFHPLAQVNVDVLEHPILPVGHGSGHEFNIGDCEVTVLEVTASNALVLSAWEPFVADPAELDLEVGFQVPVDHTRVAVLDRFFDVNSAYVTEGDGIQIYASVSGSGPAPVPGAPAFVDGCDPNPSAVGEPNKTLALYRVFYDWDAEQDLFVGMVHPSLPTEFGGGIATESTDAVTMRMTDSFGNSEPWYHSGAETMAHEAGHAAGLKHVPCKDTDGDGVPDELAGGAVDLSHPAALTFPTCTLADVDPDGFYGFDVYWGLWNLDGPTVISNNPNQAQPNRSWPFMAYRNPGWPDPYHYCRLLVFYGVDCDPTADLGIGWDPPNAGFGGPLVNPVNPTHDDPAVPLLVIAGFVDPNDGTHELTALTVIEEPTETVLDRYARQSSLPVHDGDARLVVLGSDGAERYVVGIDGQSPSHEPQSRLDFMLLVPFGPGDASVELRLPDGTSLETRGRSSSPPVVSIGQVQAGPEIDDEVLVGFEASDADGDDLTFTVLYAPDAEHWQVVATGLETTTLTLPSAAGLPGGDAPTIRVVAFDGMLSAEARAPVDMPEGSNTPPRVWLTGNPAAIYPLGALVRLEAAAFDLEDRTLPADAVTWSSSRDGDLGTGTELEIGDLSAGDHEVTVSAVDSHNAITAVRFQITVDGTMIAAAPDASLTAEIEDLFTRYADGADLGAVPVTETVGGGGAGGPPWLPIALGGAAAAAAAGAYVIRRMPGRAR